MRVIRISTHGWCVIIISVLVLFLYYLSSLDPIGHLQGDVVSIRRLLARCIILSEEAGDAIKSVHFNSESKFEIKQEGSGSYKERLTAADLHSHRIIVSGLSHSFPRLKVISEEHELNPGYFEKPIADVYHTEFQSYLPNDDLFVPLSDLVIWVDPLDATQEFTEGLFDYVTVMVCVALHGHPIIGIIHQPFMNKTFWAWDGYALSGDLQMTLRNRTQNNQTNENRAINIIHSRSHLEKPNLEQFARLYPLEKFKFTPAGGSGFKVLKLIQGTADIYIHPSDIRRWDICAADAVLRAAGGRLTGIDGSKLEYKSDSNAVIPSKIGIFATPTVQMHNKWIDKWRQYISSVT